MRVDSETQATITMLNRILGVLIIGVSLVAAWVMMEFDSFQTTPLNLPRMELPTISNEDPA